MKHLNEVCKLLMDEADQRYELTKSKLEAASLKSDADIAPQKKSIQEPLRNISQLPLRLSF